MSNSRLSKCISGINLIPADHNLFTISFVLYVNKILPNRRILLKGISNFKLLNSPLAFS